MKKNTNQSEQETSSNADYVSQLKPSGKSIDAASEKPPQYSNSAGSALPVQLKQGLESMSGEDLSDVQVHYNSPEPEKINALAFAQGSDIYMGGGQEQHLAHEAAHVVQQKQNRVKPTENIGGIAVNSNPGLEAEADRMGEAALSAPVAQAKLKHTPVNKPVAQRTPAARSGHAGNHEYGSNQTGPVAHQGAGDAHAISPNDVNQGALGDCFFLSSLMAVAVNSPEILERGIGPQNSDGSYPVTLHRRVSDGWFGTKLEATTLNIQPSFYQRTDGNQTNVGGYSQNEVYARGGDTDSSGNTELWVKLYEKAYAGINGGYEEINGGVASNAIEAITGQEASTTNFNGVIWDSSETEVRDMIVTAISEGKPVVVDRMESNHDSLSDEDRTFAQNNNIVGPHSYAVLSADNSNITVRNPHGMSAGNNGSRAEVTMTWAQFRRLFQRMNTTD